MVKKEISEIKKLFTENNCSITRICGCYVDGEKNKKTQFRRAFLSLPEDEIGKYLEILRKTLSGTVGKNLHTLNFPTESEQEGGTQSGLLQIRNSQLQDDGLLDQFFTDIIESYEYAGNYLILVIYDTYDIPGKASDGRVMHDASEEVYSYIMTSICPVKLSKPGLSYETEENAFHDRIRDWVVGAPETGFLFPAFNDRSADIHSLLYYSKDTKDLRERFVNDLLGCSISAAPDTQKKIFQRLVEDVLGENCTVEAVNNIQGRIIEMAEDHKDDAVPLTLDKNEIKGVFSESGVPEDRLQDFEQLYATAAVADPNMEFYADNIVNKRVLEVSSQGIQLKVDTDYADRISTQVIGGKTVLQIELLGDVEVNGISVKKQET